MSRVDQATRCVLGRLVPRASPLHDEIVEMAADRSRRRGGIGRVVEVWSAAALGLRLRCRSATGDDPRQIVAQGAAWAAPTVLALVVAWTSIALTAGTTEVQPVVAGLAVASALVAIARPALDHVRFAAAVVGVGLTVVVAVGASATVPGLLRPEVLVAGSAVVPIALLAAGWLDPRLAVVATSVWCWRFVSLDLGQLAAGLETLAGELSVESVVVRWVAMAGGVLGGWLVTHQAIGRAREI